MTVHLRALGAALGVIVTMIVVLCGGVAVDAAVRTGRTTSPGRPVAAISRLTIAARSSFGLLADCPSTPIAMKSPVDDVTSGSNNCPVAVADTRHRARRARAR